MLWRVYCRKKLRVRAALRAFLSELLVVPRVSSDPSDSSTTVAVKPGTLALLPRTIGSAAYPVALTLDTSKLLSCTAGCSLCLKARMLLFRTRCLLFVVCCCR